MVFIMDDTRLRRLRRLSMVPRWNGVPTLRNQYVDQHSFQVMPIALWLLQWSSLSNPNVQTDVQKALTEHEVMMYCMIHDEGEAVYGDVPSPSKFIVGSALRSFDEKRGLGQTEFRVVKNLVKCADCLEALVFCEEEKAMGNTSLVLIHEDIFYKFSDAWRDFEYRENGEWPGIGSTKPDPEQVLEELWSQLNITHHPVLDEILAAKREEQELDDDIPF